jgi:hypothetical protein
LEYSILITYGGRTNLNNREGTKKVSGIHLL